MDLKPLIPIVIEVLKGITGKTQSKIDDAVLMLVIAILEQYDFIKK